jgi:peptide-methionine (S)-S-oxide reductase
MANKEGRELERATLGAGCFWCVEAIFRRLEGVEAVDPGYSGGTLERPAYEQVCTGKTGHAEVCQIMFDPSRVSYETILEVFWMTHDPTTKNRQGNDIGMQYRSVIFFHNNKQRKLAEEYKTKLDAAKIWEHPILTEIVPYERFWPAEEYHRDYYANNPGQSYCAYVIAPKVEKFQKAFNSRLKGS